MTTDRQTELSPVPDSDPDPDVPDWSGQEGRILDGYPGAALIVRADGSVLAANPKAAGLEALLRHRAVPEVLDLVGHAAGDGTIAAGTVTLEGSQGAILLEITVIPAFSGGEGEGHLLLLARDLTMERNLRTALVESRQRYKDLVELSSDFSWEVDAEGAFVFVSPNGALGYRADELVGRPAVDLVTNPDDYSPVPFKADRPVHNVELWMRQKGGATASVVLAALPLYDGSGNWRGARGNCKDVTEERESEAALARARHREHLLQHIVSTIRDEVEPANMLSAAAAATGRALGAAGCQIHRLHSDNRYKIAARYGSEEDLDGLEEALKSIKGETEVAAFCLGEWSVLATPTHYRHEINGALSMWRASSKGEWDDDHRLLLADVANQLGIANEQIANHERIVALSRTDGMTGLLNRRAFFEDELPRRVARLARSGQSAALFYVDMDNFKRVNDVRGHQAGDEAILALRDLLLEFSRPGDVIARLGGDEFALWMDGISADVAPKRAGMLIESSRQLRRFSGDEAHPLGISVGVALYDSASGESLDDLLARADAAMYEVKHSSKGSFRVAPPPGTPLTLPADAKKKAK